MALPVSPLSFVEPDDFTRNVARNIRTLLAMKDTTAKAVAPAMRMTPTKFSQRMTGDSRWLAAELANLARVLGVTVDVLTAQGEEEFREALSSLRSRCISAVPDPANPLQTELWHDPERGEWLSPSPRLVAVRSADEREQELAGV